MATTNKTFRVKSGLTVEGGVLYPAAGTTAIAPILFTSGTNLTTATAGAMEYDGTSFYITAAAGGRKTIATTDLLATATRLSGTGGTYVSGDVLIQGTGLISTSQSGNTITVATTATSNLGTVTSASVVSANGFAGTVANASTTPAITLTTTVTGLLSGNGTAISAASAGYGDTTNPYASKTANYFLAAPNGSAGSPVFRAIVAADIPTLNQNTTGSAGSVTNSLTIGTGLSGTVGTYNGSAAVTVSLPNVGTAGTYTKVTTDAQGRVSSGTTLSASDIPTLGNITNAGAIGSTAGLMIKTTTSGVLTALAAGTTGQYLQFDGTWSTPPNYFPTAVTAVTSASPTTNGPTLGLTMNSGTVTTVDIPAASATVSGAITTGTQTIAGAKTYSGAATFNSTVTVPTPTNATDAANKAYVDNAAQGVNAHDAVQYATTTTLAAVYTAGTTGADGGTGVGAIITFSATGTTTIDSGSTLAVNDRVLVKDGITADAGTTSKANGIYYVTTAGTTGVATILTRALDHDNSIAGDIMAGDLIYVIGGTTNGTSQFIETATGTATSPAKGIKIGTDGITFTQFSGANATTAGAGLSASGNVFNVGTASTARIVVNADNIDLAGVTYTAPTASGTATSFVTGLTVDAYGRVSGGTSSTVPTATSSVLGLASFGAEFTVTAGAVSVNSVAFSKITGTVPTTQGGTGLTTFTSGGAVYATSTSVLTTGTLPVSAGGTGITSFGTGVATFLATPSSANLLSAITDETGTGTLVFSASPALTGTVTFGGNAGIVNASGSTTGTTALTLSSVYDRTVYNGGEFIVKATNGSNIEITKILVVTDGTNVYVTNYGDVFVSSSLVTVDFTYSTNNVNIVITPVAGTTGTTTAKVTGTLLAV